MINRTTGAVAMVVAIALGACSSGVDPATDRSWQQEFALSECELVPTGRNDFWILEPGFQLVLEGRNEKLAITVLDETKAIDGISTRVVEEREWRDDEVIEVSRNFFAACAGTNDIFYFGEEVDDYRNGELVGHAGAWLAGRDGAKAGMIMSGDPEVGMKYYQEIAPKVALDRAEVLSLDETLDTPAGVFTEALRTREGTALNTREKEFKTYAKGIGLIQDQFLLLTEYGFIASP